MGNPLAADSKSLALSPDNDRSVIYRDVEERELR